ncbi:hypothetical protein TNCV_3516181 [Trichonephila clavipes]|nr:hypothetical protein TNCV_3516181 [Trichonephila clavipes]
MNYRKETHVNSFYSLIPSHIWIANYLNEEEFRPVEKNTFHGGYPQCQSDRLIDSPSIWSTRYINWVNLIHSGLLSQRTNRVRKKRGVPRADSLRSPIRDIWGCERIPPR